MTKIILEQNGNHNRIGGLQKGHKGNVMEEGGEESVFLRKTKERKLVF